MTDASLLVVLVGLAIRGFIWLTDRPEVMLLMLAAYVVGRCWPAREPAANREAATRAAELKTEKSKGISKRLALEHAAKRGDL